MVNTFVVSLLLAAAAGSSLLAQNSPSTPKKTDKATAYYHYSLGHLYAELAGAYGGKGDYVAKAIENFRAAMKADPNAGFIAEELSDLYIQAGRISDAVTEAQELLKLNPDDVNARRLLGRMYTRMIGDPQNPRTIDETMLKRALEQYQKIVEKAPSDADSWLMLGRLYKISQNSPDSEKAYKKVLELEPEMKTL